MGIIEIFLTGVGLSMDAFAVSVCKGLNMRKISYFNATVISLFFGGFQALMPLIGYTVASRFREYIESVDHWIAFLLLAIIGGKMLYEAITDKDAEKNGNGADVLDLKELTVLAVATSIDALAVGVTLALRSVNIWLSISVIGVTTFALSFVGVVIGNKVGSIYNKKAGILGGAVLILIGLKILLEDLGVINL